MEKRASLVCQHLENLGRAVLERYQAIIRNYVRGREGVYALYSHGKLYYVGLAGDLQWRLKRHLKDKHGESWDRFSVYLTIGDSHLKELESLLLRVIQPKPKGNTQSGRFANSENLHRKFRKDIKDLQAHELASLVGGKELLKAKVRAANAKADSKIDITRYLRGANGLRLRAVYKGRTLTAKLRRDGKIRFRKKLYKSPSAAGVAAVGHSCNGWRFWKFERAPGDWVSLKGLRR